ncbi:MAG: hypothetical protein WCL04_02780 [Verrucomicrobiota bacterium]
MKSYFFSSRLGAIAFVSALLPASLGACSICGCSLSADWAEQSFSDTAGLLASLRFEYIDQNNLRSGTGRVATGALIFPNPDEIQLSTISRNVWFDLDWNSGGAWGLSLSVPFHDRSHRSIVDGDTVASTSQASGVGDVRVSARYSFTTPGRTRGVTLQLGLKLPTGRTDQTFATGPQAGTPLDRALQLGTGTTDLLANVTGFARPGPYWGWFAQAQAVRPLNTHDSFRPSPSLGVNLGVRRLTNGWVTPQLQLNARWDGRESGANADTPNSGGTFVFLSPGLTVELGSRASAFAIVQLPVWQRVNGLQLEPNWLLSTGVRWQF